MAITIETVAGLRSAFGIEPNLYLFSEPGVEDLGIEQKYGIQQVYRPQRFAHDRMPISPEGRLGNFSNWVQTARDLLYHEQDEYFLICEDDIAITPNSRSLIESRLWPAPDCGVISLYCPAMSQYPMRPGLNRTNVRYQDPMTSVGNMVGALALLFPRKSLCDLVYNQDEIGSWKGSHSQARDPRTQPWERKAVDTWIGRTLIKMGYSIWHFYPSLVEHVGETSSMGHKQSRVRTARKWAGLNPDLEKMFGKPGKVYERIERVN